MTQPLAILILLVALLQVWSYPMHDPVMMDRGFLADRRTTWRSFIHAGWISTLSSSAKLVVMDMKLVPARVNNGRIAMVLFMLLGLALVFWGNKDLFSAVAVSGTASMYLAPVIFFSLWGNQRDIP